MVGFVSAISAALAIIILVVMSALIGYVKSILPESGLIKIDENKYRYIQEEIYLTDKVIGEVELQLSQLGIAQRLKSYQVGCNYGFNMPERQAFEISTFNYLTINKYFDDAIEVGKIEIFKSQEGINTCYMDINLRPGNG